MDLLLHYADEYLFDRAYAYLFPNPSFTSSLSVASAAAAAGSLNTSHLFPGYEEVVSSTASSTLNQLASTTASSASLLPRDNIFRQLTSLFIIALVGAFIMYFLFASISYRFVFDRRLEHHPRFLKNQIRQEIISSLIAMPCIDVLTLPWFLGEVRGYSMLYDNIQDRGWVYLVLSAIWFLIFTDFAIYWVHRILHHPLIYKQIHKPHHKWIVPTPFAAIAFHPVDGYSQSVPYHLFVFLFPMHRLLYLGLFIFVQLWTIFIHDGDMLSGAFWERFINSPAHHTLHHIYFTCNYGQYFTWADHYYQSHREPVPELDPLHDALKNMRKKGLIDENGNPIVKDRKE